MATADEDFDFARRLHEEIVSVALLVDPIINKATTDKIHEQEIQGEVILIESTDSEDELKSNQKKRRCSRSRSPLHALQGQVCCENQQAISVRSHEIFSEYLCYCFPFIDSPRKKIPTRLLLALV